ncbi:Rust resistance kinase Lr10 [Vitis vinifera]|uniref:Rust resistance kinase Lr10 n=1 Tax=Vitis vinifera TaxID=29760 RepID=A0A438GJD3_VITVI|nr:Rust resistance kinase Lr10 [Vitis vinifera]
MMLREAQVLENRPANTTLRLLLSICVANDQQQHQTCKPSSCGGIRNITYPFRLQGDPSGCGDPKYELICENNLTVFKQGGKKYFVAEINYHNYTIRMLDPGQKKETVSPLLSIPPSPCRPVVLLSCERPISDQNYIPIILCNRSEDNISSSSRTYAYVLAGKSLEAGLIRESCTIALTFVAQSELSSYSISDLQEKLLMGIELSFLHRLCITECRFKKYLYPFFGFLLDPTTLPFKALKEELGNYCAYNYYCNISMIEESIVSLTAARGTLGYIAPELFYKNIGGVSYKADVYSFGMLLMEMVGKRKHANTCLEQSQTYFPSWIYDRIDQGEDMEIGDATEDEHKYIRKIVIVALWCVQMNPTDRPSMSKALEMLEGEVELLQMPPGLLYTPGRCQLRII